MDVVNTYDTVELHNILFKHDILVPAITVMNKPMHVLIFQDEQNELYHWITTSYPDSFVRGHKYDLEARIYDSDKANNKLSNVHILKHEQPDAEDVLLGLDSYK